MLQLQLLAYEFGFLVTLHADSLLSRVKSNTVPFQGPKYDEFFERAQRITLLGVSSNFGCGIGTPLKKREPHILDENDIFPYTNGLERYFFCSDHVVANSA